MPRRWQGFYQRLASAVSSTRAPATPSRTSTAKIALIAWRSLAGADVDNAGSVRFVPAPDGNGTDVKVVLDYIPPAGRLGGWVAKLLGDDPHSEIREDLRSFKRMMEAGTNAG